VKYFILLNQNCYNFESQIYCLMNPDELARILIEKPFAEAESMLAANSAFESPSTLAKALQNLSYEVWTSEPQKISNIVSVLRVLENRTRSAEVSAYREWTEAIENLVGGNLEKCVRLLDASENSFNLLGEILQAATTQISKLYALALLGRYNEAIECGLRAREVFLQHKDFLSTGKIEHNIGNLYWRRDFYAESEPYLASAHKHFARAGDERQMAMVENCQAFVKALQNDFRAAEKIYATAIDRARKNSFVVTEAEIEIGMSNLYLYEGRLDQALRFMESSRCKYEQMAMPQQTANCEMEIADIYLELNLLPEATDLYESAVAKFTALKMQSELARCSLNYARALFLFGDKAKANMPLDRAETLYRREGNRIAAASAEILKAQILFFSANFTEAKTLAKKARKIFFTGKNPRLELSANWLLAEIDFAENRFTRARLSFAKTLEDACRLGSSSIESLCLFSLGKIALAKNDLTEAEDYFRQAVKIIENTRSSLEAEEFRLAFFSDKLKPYHELARIKIAERNFREALLWLERARARALVDSVIGRQNNLPDSAEKRSAAETKVFRQIETSREELNWFYSRLYRTNSASGLNERKKLNSLKSKIAAREKKLGELERRSFQTKNGNGVFAQTDSLDLDKLQNSLDDTTLVEYFINPKSEISAFVVTQNEINFCENISADVSDEIRQFLFQLKTGRFAKNLSAANRATADSRLLKHSRNLYSSLIEPIHMHLKTKRVVFVRTGSLNYLPFNALCSEDGKYFIEKSEISYAPSAAILQNCLERKSSKPESVLLVAVKDSFTPFVEQEIDEIGNLFAKPLKLKGKQSIFKNIREKAKLADAIHFACHARFRPDNPLFSALSLYKENLTVRDARELDLRNKLVVLSACETGLNRVETDEEILGLTRGFLSAGAASLVLSLWTIHDETAKKLMLKFYKRLLSFDENPAAALRSAQIDFIDEKTHPYFWSAFFVAGKW
jgi:CHAT domain-containing protein